MRHNGETEGQIQYRVGRQIGRDKASEEPQGVDLGEALARHMHELTSMIRLGPFEYDYRAGFATGWLRARWSRCSSKPTERLH